MVEFNESVRQFEASQALKIEQMNQTAKKSSSSSSSKKKETVTPLSNINSTSEVKNSLKK